MDLEYSDWPVTQETRRLLIESLKQAESALSGCHEVCFQSADKARNSEQYAALESVRRVILLLGDTYLR